MYYFVDAKQAMTWATEVLRKRRFPKNGVFYQDAVNEDDETQDNQEFYGSVSGCLPSTADERVLLATKVYGLLNGIDEKYREAMLNLYWGDYLHDDGYKKATYVQEYLRQKGIRTRLCYRYSYRQAGVKMGVDHKTAQRWENYGLEQLHKNLMQMGLLEENLRNQMSA
jgi:hypothetical protein